MSASSPLSPDVPALAGLWRASELGGRAQAAVAATGHAALDAVLPGGGWPVGALTELLAEPHQRHEWGLLAPLLARLPTDRQVVLVGSPQPGTAPFGPALAGRGLAPERLLWVLADTPAGLAWAAAQALGCRDVAAVLAWLPQASTVWLRRLQLLAQRQGQLLFVVRDAALRAQASPAPLRLWLQALAVGEGGGDDMGEWAAPGLAVHVLKRQGPPLDAPVRLHPHPARLQAQLRASRSERLHRRHAAHHGPMPPVAQPGPALVTGPARSLAPATGAGHALDRAAAAG